MFKARPKREPLIFPKLFQNGNEHFEVNFYRAELKVVGRRLIHYRNGRMIGAATVRKLKQNP